MTPLLPESERAVVGHDHAEIGALLFERWRLPKVLVEAVAHHHDPTLVPGVAGLVGAVNTLLGCSDDDREAAFERAAAAGVTEELWRENLERGAAAAL